MSWIPAHFQVTFDLDRERNRYQLTVCPPGFNRVPAELIVERRQSDTIRADADLILRGPDKEKTEAPTKSKRLKFFTGLLPTEHTNYYDGNVLTSGRNQSKVKNYVLIRFSPDAGQMTLLYVPGWKPYPNERANFVRLIINQGLL